MEQGAGSREQGGEGIRSEHDTDLEGYSVWMVFTVRGREYTAVMPREGRGTNRSMV